MAPVLPARQSGAPAAAPRVCCRRRHVSFSPARRPSRLALSFPAACSARAARVCAVREAQCERSARTRDAAGMPAQDVYGVREGRQGSANVQAAGVRSSPHLRRRAQCYAHECAQRRDAQVGREEICDACHASVCRAARVADSAQPAPSSSLRDSVMFCANGEGC